MKKRKPAKKARGEAKVVKHVAKNSEEFRRLIGPGAVDQAIRNALHLMWMMYYDSKNLDEVESEFQRLVDRAMKDYRENQDRWRTGPFAP